MSQNLNSAVAVIGIDIGKNSSHVVGQDDRGADLYASLPVVPLPNMQLALAEYRSRVEALAAQCRTLGIRCVFMTQPSLWREDLDSETRKLLCCSVVCHRTAPSGWNNQAVKPQGRLHIKDSASTMARYNEVLMEACSSQNLDCLDLASQIPKTAEMFFDDFHFTEVGSRRVATVIAGYLNECLQSEPATLRGPEVAAHPSAD